MKEKEIRKKAMWKIRLKILGFIITGGLFTYIGYLFCVENNYDVIKGAIFGAMSPFAVTFIKEIIEDSLFWWIIFIIIFIIVCDYIPTFVGAIILLILIICNIIKILKEYNTEIISEENLIKSVVNGKKIKNEKMLNQIYNSDDNQEHISDDFIENEIKEYDSEDILDDISNNTQEDYLTEKEEYFCERCGEKISEEEYNENCGLCEDCDVEVHFGERYDGDDYDLYK